MSTSVFFAILFFITLLVGVPLFITKKKDYNEAIKEIEVREQKLRDLFAARRGVKKV